MTLDICTAATMQPKDANQGTMSKHGKLAKTVDIIVSAKLVLLNIPHSFYYLRNTQIVTWRAGRVFLVA